MFIYDDIIIMQIHMLLIFKIYKKTTMIFLNHNGFITFIFILFLFYAFVFFSFKTSSFAKSSLVSLNVYL